MSDYFLTYLWTWMECFSAILLFDAFSARKRNRVVHWITVTAVAFLDATLLNFAATTMPNYSKIVIAFALSTKENPSFHGYGLQNVHTTLEKYHTLYAMDYENGWFEFATELPNTLIS